jgi:hypothetical protein
MSEVKQAGDPAERGSREMPDTASSQREVPHVTENDKSAETSGRQAADHSGAPALPANASGVDEVDVNEQSQPIDPASMYDRRPEEGEDHPPSSQPG